MAPCRRRNAPIGMTFALRGVRGVQMAARSVKYSSQYVANDRFSGRRRNRARFSENRAWVRTRNCGTRGWRSYSVFHFGRVVAVDFAIDPPALQGAPLFDAHHGGGAAVDIDELAALRPDDRDPVAPAVDAEQARMAALERQQQLALGAQRAWCGEPSSSSSRTSGQRGRASPRRCRPTSGFLRCVTRPSHQ